MNRSFRELWSIVLSIRGLNQEISSTKDKKEIERLKQRKKQLRAQMMTYLEDRRFSRKHLGSADAIENFGELRLVYYRTGRKCR